MKQVTMNFPREQLRAVYQKSRYFPHTYSTLYNELFISSTIRSEYTYSPPIHQDYFERKRLQSRVQRARPLSPGADRTKKPVSQDLIFLQALTCAHDTTKGAAFSIHCSRVLRAGVFIEKLKQGPEEKDCNIVVEMSVICFSLFLLQCIF